MVTKPKRKSIGKYGGDPDNFINKFWRKHNGKKVMLDGLAYKIKYSEHQAIYPRKHIAVSVSLEPVNKRSEYYQKFKKMLGDDWVKDAKDISDITMMKIFKQLER